MINPLEISFLKALMDAENGPRVGWDESKGLWFPHSSIEGGSDTIGYGHKLTQNDLEMGSIYNGISDLYCVKLFLDDYTAAREKAEISWHNHYNNVIDEKYMLILTDIVYNTGYVSRDGAWRWPKLAQAITAQDDQGVYRESLRWYTTPMGIKKPLTHRTSRICRSVGIKFQA